MNQIVAGLIGCGVFVTMVLWVGSEGNPIFLGLFLALAVAGLIAAVLTKPDEVIPSQRPLED